MRDFLSLHMIVKDEELLLGRLLEHVAPHVGEMVIVDTGSTDGTYEIARVFTSKVYTHDLNGSFAQTRNFALDRATKPWILHLDADEWPNEELLAHLDGLIVSKGTSGIDGLSIVRHNLVDGKEIGKATWERHIRVFRSKLRFTGRIHERLLVDPTTILPIPNGFVIQHFKSQERQERQNRFYMQWEEQRMISRGPRWRIYGNAKVDQGSY